MNYCPFCMSEISDGVSVCPSCGRRAEEYVSPPHVLPVGALLHQRYLVGGVLGEGGFGITYIGLDTLLQVRVAVKEFFPNGMVNRNNTVSNEVLSISAETAKELFSKSRESFLHEARTLAKFTNEPGVVAVRDFFEENNTVYIVMEYLDGVTLKSYLKQVGRISPNNTVCLLMPVFRSLRKIHEKGLIHRDISPDNIMLVGEQVKLLDFGAAREYADERSLSVMLKHGYAPLEQYRRHGVQGAWTDVYAVCAVMYRCITGSVPPDAPDRVFDDELKMPSELGIDTEPAFEEVLRSGLAIKPDERYQNIDELLEAIDAVPGIDIEEPYERTENYENINVAEQPVDDNITVNDKPSGDNRDNRLSEYVPRFSDSREEVLPEEAEPQTAAPAKKKSRLPLIIGIAAASAVVIGAAVTAFLIYMNSTKKTPVPYVQAFTETTAAGTQSSSETQSPDGTEPFSVDLSEIEYPDMGSYISIDGGFLTVDTSLFGMELTDVAHCFMPGSLYWSANYPDFPDDTYKILCIPIDSPVNYEGHNNGTYIESVDLIFRDNKLVVIQYDKSTAFNPDVIEQARQRYGQPVTEENEKVVWELDGGITYAACMQHIESDTLDLTDFFNQRYYSPDESPR